MSVLQKFEKFALTKEQGNVLKGGSQWTCEFSRKGGGKESRVFHTDNSAVSACRNPTSVGFGESYSCDGCAFIQ